MKPIYNWRQGAHVKGGVKAQTAGEELARIQELYGYCTSEIVLAEAVDPDAPLHPLFTWDDAEAADLYRKAEARVVIRSVEVIYEDSTASEPMLTLVRLQEVEGETVSSMSQYLPTRDVVKVPDFFEKAWRDASDAAGSMQKRIETLERIAEEQNRPELRKVRRATRAMRKAVEAMG